jgi:hypothetical protein
VFLASAVTVSIVANTALIERVCKIPVGPDWQMSRFVPSATESDGFALDLLDVERPLLRSVTQTSHIRLTEAEFARARDLFGT